MKTMTRILSVLLVVCMLLAVAACSKAPERPAVYTRADDEAVYQSVLAKYEELCAQAKAAATDDERFVLYAEAEAYLLDAAVMSPYTTQGGAYTMSRVAPKTIPFVKWGNDDDRLKGLVISNEFITKEERAELLDQWAKAVAGEGAYDPAAYLTGKGHTLVTDYMTTFSTAPVTLDWLNTSEQSDTEITVNTVDGLVEYDNLGNMQPALAESWEVSDDGLTYTFKIRDDAYWYTSEGKQYAKVTAEDFVNGFHHMLDAQAGLEWLVDGVIVGATKYYAEGGSWDEVGYKAAEGNKLVITLESPHSYFLTMLAYSCFLPLCTSFYESRGGVYGVEEYAKALEDTNKYTFGKSTDVASQVYCGPFLVQKLLSDSEIKLVKNAGYYKPESVKLTSITWVYDNGENPTQFYKDVLAGTYAGVTLNESTGLLKMAKDDGNFDKYSYVSDTTTTSYLIGLNLNRGTFALESGAVASPKNDAQKIDSYLALQNKDFRKALLLGVDRVKWNGVTRGADLAATNLRNMYTHPEFVKIANDVTASDGHKFAAGTQYGEIVQYFCDKIGAEVKVADGADGWFNAESAKKHLDKAVKDLGKSVTWPIQLDVVYYSASDSQVSQATAYKQLLEETLGSDHVKVNLVEATTSDDFYASGYRASTGEAGNFDVFYGSGWGPDFGDPCSYLDTFLGEGAGYMTKICGLF